MGLGTWFIRELEGLNNKHEFTKRFFKIQLLLGAIFYILNLTLILIIYDDKIIIYLSFILGINIIFDNLIYGIRSLNIANSQQKKTAVIMVIDGFMKLLISLSIFIFPISILTFAVLVVVSRFITLNLFFRIGTNKQIDIKSILFFRISIEEVKRHVLLNWRFVAIVGLSIVFWRSATVIISRYLSLIDVANYEIAYKVFSVFVIIPIVISSTLFPKFVKLIKNEDYKYCKNLYKKVVTAYLILSVLSYAFIQSFADYIILNIFGTTYLDASNCLKEMFLTFLVFPTALLQANLIVALRMEKIDMYFNLAALILNLSLCIIGLYYYKSLLVINYSIFASFLIFHILQSGYLLKLKYTSIRNIILFYFILFGSTITYNALLNFFNPTLLFLFFLIIVGCTIFLAFDNIFKKFTLKASNLNVKSI